METKNIQVYHCFMHKQTNADMQEILFMFTVL